MKKFVDGMNKLLFDRYTLLNKEEHIQLLVLRKNLFSLISLCTNSSFKSKSKFPRKKKKKKDIHGIYFKICVCSTSLVLDLRFSGVPSFQDLKRYKNPKGVRGRLRLF